MAESILSYELVCCYWSTKLRLSKLLATAFWDVRQGLFLLYLKMPEIANGVFYV